VPIGPAGDIYGSKHIYYRPYYGGDAGVSGGDVSV